MVRFHISSSLTEENCPLLEQSVAVTFHVFPRGLCGTTTTLMPSNCHLILTIKIKVHSWNQDHVNIFKSCASQVINHWHCGMNMHGKLQVVPKGKSSYVH